MVKYRYINLTHVRIILGLVLIVVGIVVTLKGDWLYDNFGTIPFFEQYFHSSGGGRFGYKISGVLVTFVGILVLTNIHASILEAIARLFVFGGRQ